MPKRLPLQRLAWLAFCYLAWGAAFAVLLAWTLGNTIGTGNGTTSTSILERDGRYWVVISSRAAIWKDVLIRAEPTQSKAAFFESKYRELEARHAGVDSEKAVVPEWAQGEWAQISRSAAPRSDGILVSAIGWPFLCVKHCSWGPNMPLSGILWVAPRVAIVYLPICRGLLLDGLLFSPIPVLLHRFWRWRGRATRRVLNQCPNCGYDMSGAVSPRCPECGAEDDVA